MTDDADWAGRSVFVLALACAVGFVVAVLAAAVAPDPFGGSSGRVLSAGFGAILGVVSGYLVSLRLDRRRAERDGP